jgi:phosphate transport system permease protein
MATLPVTSNAENKDVGRIWSPPNRSQLWTDGIFRRLCLIFATFTIVLLGALVCEIALKAAPAFKEFGFGFLTSRTWDPNTETYGILPEIWGTLYTSLLALLVGSLFGVAAAVFLSEGYMSDAIYSILKRFNLHTGSSRLR